MAFPNISDIATTAIESRTGEIRDNVTNNNAVLAMLQMGDRIKPVDGGRLIYEELSFAQNSNGGWYSGYDTLPTAAADVLSAAEFAWKQYAVPVTVSGLELLQVTGKEQIIDLLESRIGVAEATMANDLSTGLYSDGTGAGGKQIVGLDAAVPDDPTTGTYGAINRATYTFWRSAIQTNTVNSAATAAQYMNSLWAKCKRGKDVPDLILAGSTIWQWFLATLQNIQRINDPKLAELGFDNLKFISAPVILDGGIGGAANTNKMYFLNTKYLRLRPHKDRNMVPLDPKKRVAINQDAEVSILAWAGALTCAGAKFQGRLNGA